MTGERSDNQVLKMSDSTVPVEDVNNPESAEKPMRKWKKYAKG